MDSRHLSAEITVFNEVKDRIAAIYHLEGNDEALFDTVDGETNLTDMIADIIRASRRAKADVEAMAGIIKDNQDRKDRHEKRAESLRGLAAWAMSEANITKITKPDLTVSVRIGAPSLTIDEGALAARYVKQITTSRPDKDAIKAAVDAGDVPEGVTVSNGSPVLTARFK